MRNEPLRTNAPATRMASTVETLRHSELIVRANERFDRCNRLLNREAFATNRCRA